MSDRQGLVFATPETGFCFVFLHLWIMAVGK